MVGEGGQPAPQTVQLAAQRVVQHVALLHLLTQHHPPCPPSPHPHPTPPPPQHTHTGIQSRGGGMVGEGGQPAPQTVQLAAQRVVQHVALLHLLIQHHPLSTIPTPVPPPPPPPLSHTHIQSRAGGVVGEGCQLVLQVVQLAVQHVAFL